MSSSALSGSNAYSPDKKRPGIIGDPGYMGNNQGGGYGLRGGTYTDGRNRPTSLIPPEAKTLLYISNEQSGLTKKDTVAIVTDLVNNANKPGHSVAYNGSRIIADAKTIKNLRGGLDEAKIGYTASTQTDKQVMSAINPVFSHLDRAGLLKETEYIVRKDSLNERMGYAGNAKTFPSAFGLNGKPESIISRTSEQYNRDVGESPVNYGSGKMRPNILNGYSKDNVKIASPEERIDQILKRLKNE